MSTFVAARLRSEPVAAILSSPLERARETAEPIAAAFGVEIETEPDLDELDFGAWSGQSFDALGGEPLWAAWNADRDRVRPPDGETFAEAQSRAVRCIERIRRRHAGGTVALVSHADLIKGVLAWTLGLPLAFYARFEVAPASVSRVAFGDGGPKVVGMNHTVPA